MARRKRRDEDDAVDELLDQDADEEPGEAADEPDALDDQDDLDEEFEEEFEDDDEAEPAGRSDRGGGGTAVKRRAATDTKSKTKRGKEAKADKDKTGKDKPKRPTRVGLFGRLVLFLREVVAELRKVIWPTRRELLTYTVVVVFFVVVMLSIIGLLDVGFAKVMLWVFGSNTAEE